MPGEAPHFLPSVLSALHGLLARRLAAMAGHGWVAMQHPVPEQGSPMRSWCVASPQLVEAEETFLTTEVFGEWDAVFACYSVQPSFAAAVSHHPEAEEAQVPSSCPSCSSSRCSSKEQHAEDFKIT